MTVAVFPGDPSLLDTVLALALLVGIPVFALVVIATLAAYIRQDAAEYVAELEAELEEGELEPGNDSLPGEPVERRLGSGGGDGPGSETSDRRTTGTDRDR